MDQDDSDTWHEAGPIGLGDIVLDGDPAPLPKKGTEPSSFGPFRVAKRLDASRWR